MAKYADIDYKLNTVNKDLRLATDIEAINNSIRNILNTPKGSVPGNPTFGSDLEGVLFEVIDDITFSLIQNIIIDELEKWEERITIQEVNLNSIIDDGQISVNIIYIVNYNNEIVSSNIKINFL
jgi:uncharacterized protein